MEQTVLDKPDGTRQIKNLGTIKILRDNRVRTGNPQLDRIQWEYWV